MIFLHSFHPNSILLQLGPVKIHWYGFFMVLAILAGLGIVIKLAKKYGHEAESVYDLAFYLIIFSLLGARIYAVLLFPDYYFSHPSEIAAVWKGGLAIHGAIIAGIITLFFYSKKKKQSFWKWADILVIALALGQAIGRWGNYFNQELYGRPTNLPWGIPIDPINRLPGYVQFEYFHPVFLYESILNLLVFLILLSLYWHRAKKGSGFIWEKTGFITLLYLIFYSFIRILMEQFRIDETPVFFGIRLPALISLAIIIASILIFIRLKKVSTD